MISTSSFPFAKMAASLVAFLAPITWGQEAKPVSVQDVQAILLRSDARTARTEEQVLNQLEALGAGGAGIFFAFYAGGPEFDELFEVDGIEPRDVQWWGRPDEYGDLSARLLSERFPDATLVLLTARLATGASLDDRLGALHLSSDLATKPALELWLEIAQGLSKDEISAYITRVTLRKSLANHLKRRPEAHGHLLEALQGMEDPTLRDECSRAIERAADPRSLWLLLALLENAQADVPGPPVEDLIERINPLARRYPWILGERWNELLFSLARDQRPEVKLVALGALAGEAEALELLTVTLNESKSPHEAQAVRRALAESFHIRADVPVITFFGRVERGLEWWLTSGEELAHSVADLKASELGLLYRDFAAHPAYSKPLAHIVASQMEFMPVETFLGSLAFLVDLGEPGAVPFLVDVLRSCDEDVIGEVASTIEVLTGLKHGRDYSAWMQALAL
ncbi:MAG: hypothetical protein ACI9K5_003096 [Gammaproteobacteria bacterium]|jgi:hypothetical protein